MDSTMTRKRLTAERQDTVRLPKEHVLIPFSRDGRDGAPDPVLRLNPGESTTLRADGGAC